MPGANGRPYAPYPGYQNGVAPPPPPQIIAWRPDGEGDASTWAEVYDLVLRQKFSIIDVYNTALTFEIPPNPAGGPYLTPLNTWIFQNSSVGAPDVIVDILDGAQLDGQLSLSGAMTLRGNAMGPRPGLKIEPSGPSSPEIVRVELGARLTNRGSTALWRPTTNLAILAMLDNSTMDTTAGPVIEGTSPLNTLVLAQYGASQFGAIGDGTVGGRLQTLIYESDGLLTTPLPTMAGLVVGNVQTQLAQAAAWTTATRPQPVPGVMGLNVNTSKLEFFDGAAWRTVTST